MASFVHARKTAGGELRFRIWSNCSDSYISEEMTEKEVREWTLQEAVCDAIRSHLREIDGRVKRAAEIGTSSLMGDTRNLNAPWDKERK